RCSVKVLQLAAEQSEGPAVAQSVMDRHDEDMILRRESDQRGANCRFRGEVHRSAGHFDQQTIELSRLLVRLERRQVDQLDFGLPILANDLNGAIGGIAEHGTQNLMPGDNGVEGCLQSLAIQFAAQANRIGFVEATMPGESISRKRRRRCASESGAGRLGSAAGISSVSPELCL